ncbi:MAG: flagellar biosynthesis protein FliO, partial [Burkholderia vietnamiensis]|nr:flagellar biosynthesis protein FliO [Burkholderia vietnamiensis]
VVSTSPGAADANASGSFGARFRDALAGEAAKRFGRGKER